MTSPGRQLNMLLLLLPSLLAAVRAESAERIPFYGFLPAYKIRALSPPGDGHPNDVYYDALPDPDPIPAGFEIRYPSYKFAFDVPQDPEEAAYIITEKGVGGATVKDCQHHHQHQGKQDGQHGHHHGDGHGEAAGMSRGQSGAAAATSAAPSMHRTVLPPSRATVLPSAPPTAAAVHGRTYSTGFSTTQSGPGPTTATAAVKPPTTLPSGYFRPPSTPLRVGHHVRGPSPFRPPHPSFRPSRPLYAHHSPSFRPARPSFAAPRPRQSAALLVPGHTATPPPSRFKNLKLKRGQFPAEQYRVFPGGYTRLSTYSKLSG